MIGKQVSMKSIGKSDFSGLVKYITDEQQKNERVGAITVSNCHSNEHQIAMLEIMNTQALNTRATSDKTYHLIISFRAGEQIDDATLKVIEARICQGLGFGEHQRISAVHHDTDNLHIHLAINKIHPTRYTIHDPYNDYKALAQLCQKLEQEFNLQVDNHRAHQTLSENRANDMERHSGVQSLLGWIKQECTEQIKNAQSWAELHDAMRANGLEIQERGNGLVITDGSLGVKASSVAREFSKAKLELRLGAFEAGPTQEAAQVAATQKRKAQPPVARVGRQPPPSRQNRLQNLSQLGEMQIGRGRRYEPEPVKSKVNTVELYAKYKAEQQNGNLARAAEWAKAQDRKNRLIEGAKRTSQLKRAALKAIKGVGPAKKLLYASISKTPKEDIQKINKQYAKDRQEIYDKFQRRPWADWLRAEAIAGNQQALGALRGRQAAQGLKGNTLEGKNIQPVAFAVPGHDSITKKGTVIYRLGETAVRDDGNKLNVSRGANQDGLQAALKMAMERYGDSIKVAGTEAFKEQVAQAAAVAKLPITFADAALERRRQELLQTNPTEKKHDARNSGDRPAANRGRTDSGSHVSTGLTATRSAGARSNAGRNRGNGKPLVPGAGLAGKPNLGRIGRKPPPQSQNCLRGMSELGVVHIASGSEVLLPRDVPGHLEQQGAKPIDGLRRNIFGPGLASNPGQAAADKYIAQREATRLKVSTISKHARYNHSETAADTFVGIRNVDNQTLALLKRGEEVMVLPIDDATARRLKRLAVGEVISVTPQGTIKTRGRSR